MSLEAQVDIPIAVPVVIDENVVAKTISRSTARFEVVLPTRTCRVSRETIYLDANGNQLSAMLSTIEFDFAELLPKTRNGITGMQIYDWLRAEFDERDPIVT